jgi:hypothetical protein
MNAVFCFLLEWRGNELPKGLACVKNNNFPLTIRLDLDDITNWSHLQSVSANFWSSPNHWSFHVTLAQRGISEYGLATYHHERACACRWYRTKHTHTPPRSHFTVSSRGINP